MAQSRKRKLDGVGDAADGQRLGKMVGMWRTASSIREWRRRGPTPRAVRAFGLRERDLCRLPGGAGYVWTDSRVVVKPVGYVPEHDWVCEVFTEWDSETVRVPEPVLPKGGNTSGCSVDGWGAHAFLQGRDVDPAP